MRPGSDPYNHEEKCTGHKHEQKMPRGPKVSQKRIRKLPEICGNQSLDPEVPFLVLSSDPGSLHGLQGATPCMPNQKLRVSKVTLSASQATIICHRNDLEPQIWTRAKPTHISLKDKSTSQIAKKTTSRKKTTGGMGEAMR